MTEKSTRGDHSRETVPLKTVMANRKKELLNPTDEMGICQEGWNRVIHVPSCVNAFFLFLKDHGQSDHLIFQ